MPVGSFQRLVKPYFLPLLCFFPFFLLSHKVWQGRSPPVLLRKIQLLLECGVNICWWALLSIFFLSINSLPLPLVSPPFPTAERIDSRQLVSAPAHSASSTELLAGSQPISISQWSSDSICSSSAIYSTSGQKRGANSINITLICKDIFTSLDRLMLHWALKASRIRNSSNCQGNILYVGDGGWGCWNERDKHRELPVCKIKILIRVAWTQASILSLSA